MEERRDKWNQDGTRSPSLSYQPLLGQSPLLRNILNKLPDLAQSEVRAIIYGESGTGKDLYAKAIHHLSYRQEKPFVAVNCAGLPELLADNELFGHVIGAYTGAVGASLGRVGQADGGTLFLDELDSLVLPVQAKLLRFLQDGTYYPLGATDLRRADVRLIAATNADLEEAVRHKRFREDLFYRVQGAAIRIPPLRDRPEDIPILAKHFLLRFAARYQRPARHFSPEALSRLQIHQWPGNVRELETAIENAVVFSKTEEVSIAAFETCASFQPIDFTYKSAKLEFNKRYFTRLLRAHDGCFKKAARAAGLSLGALYNCLNRCKIKRSLDCGSESSVSVTK